MAQGLGCSIKPLHGWAPFTMINGFPSRKKGTGLSRSVKPLHNRAPIPCATIHNDKWISIQKERQGFGKRDRSSTNCGGKLPSHQTSNPFFLFFCLALPTFAHAKNLRHVKFLRRFTCQELNAHVKIWSVDLNFCMEILILIWIRLHPPLGFTKFNHLSVYLFELMGSLEATFRVTALQALE